jgi:hypothetical protein
VNARARPAAWWAWPLARGCGEKPPAQQAWRSDAAAPATHVWRRTAIAGRALRGAALGRTRGRPMSGRRQRAEALPERPGDGGKPTVRDGRPAETWTKVV